MPTVFPSTNSWGNGKSFRSSIKAGSGNKTDCFKLYDATIQGRKDGSPRIQQVVLSPVDLTNVIDYIEDNTSVTVIDSEAHYNDTWILVEGTETEIDKIWDYVDTL